MSVEESPPPCPEKSSTSQLQDYGEENEFPNYADMDDEEFHLMMNSFDSYGESLFADPVFNFGQKVQYLRKPAEKCCVMGSYKDHGMQVSDLGIQSATELKSWNKDLDELDCLIPSNVDSFRVTGHQPEVELDEELKGRFTDDFWNEVSEQKESRSECVPGVPTQKKTQEFTSIPIRDPFDMSIYSEDISGSYGEQQKSERALSEENLLEENRNLKHEFTYSLGDEENLRGDKVWSILTTELSYVDADTICVLNDMETHGEIRHEISAKQKYFSSDHNNTPRPKRSKHKQTQDKTKQEHFTADNCNEPLQDDRYAEVKSVLSKQYNPDHDISTTYLWSTPRGKIEAERKDTSWFHQGRIDMDIHGRTTGYLLDGTPISIKRVKMEEVPRRGTKVQTLNDSGASKSMLNKEFYRKNPFLRKYPIYKIQPRPIKIANDEHIIVDECIHLMIRFGEHVFEMIAYLSDMLKDYDMVIGQKSMYELEGGPSFKTMGFEFMMRSVDVKSIKNVIIPSGEDRVIPLELEDCPEDLFDAENIIVKLRSNIENLHEQLPQTLICRMKNRKIEITAHNRSRKDWVIKRGDFMGCADLRSIGYFHISRRVLETAMADKCAFLSEGETQEYFAKLMEDTQELNSALNTRLKERHSKGDEQDTNIVPDKEKDPYPWLEPDDPRRTMTDEEILRKFINLENSHMSKKQKEQFYKMALRYKEAFSLRDEIGVCPDMEVELELKDKTPFFIRPFPIKETDKALIDKEMKKGVLLGILRKGMSAYSSPIMLIPRKLTGIPRIVTDFRHLNSRLVTINPSIPLVRDAIQMIGASGCEVLSVIDLRDAYHTLRLSRESQKFCGITPYYGSDTYLYQRLGMGLSVSPAIWQNFINKVLDQIPERKHHLAIMDDCLIHSKEKDHMKHLEALFKAIKDNGLKISPKKCQLFRKELVYMGHTMMIEDGLPCITPLKSRIEAIEKLGPLKTPKNCKQFCGMVNFMSMFLKDLQKDLIPIYELTKKGIPWHWGDEQKKAYETIKKKVTSPPVLVMPTPTGHFILASDTSKIACGGALYQDQKHKYRLIGFYSKKLPEACSRYSISELELTGMTCNISAFKHLLRNANFTVYVDHSALVHILKAKKEPPTLRIQKLIEHLSEYCFNIQYMKGKDMYIADFLSRHPPSDTGPEGEIIPIAFLMKDWKEGEKMELLEMVDSHNCSLCEADKALPMVTRSKAREANLNVPKAYPLTGEKRKPEQAQTGIITSKENDPVPVPPMDDFEQQARTMGDVEERILEALNRNTTAIPQDIPYEPEAQPKRNRKAKERVDYEGVLKPKPINIALGGQLPVYDADREFTFPNLMPTEEDLKRKSQRLFEYIDNNDIIRKHIPKQVELEKFLDDLKHKVIHDYDIPLTIKEMRAEYPNSPFFKDIYKYIEKGYCRYVGNTQKNFKMQCEDYITIRGVLFKIRYDPLDKGVPSLTLCIPERYIATILHQYHDNVLAGHPGTSNLWETVRQLYFFPGMYNICRQYVISCFECQSRRHKEKGMSTHFPRIPLDYKPMSRISLDLKTMPYSKMGYQHILLCTCEVTNYVVGIPLPNGRAETIANALFNRIVCIFGSPKVIICDEASALTSELMKMYYHALNTKLITISPFNHGSNKTERYIQTMSNIVAKNLEGRGDDWPLYVYPACYAMNTQVSTLSGYSPFEMVFLHKPPDLCKFDFDPDRAGIKVPTKTYMKMMKGKFEVMKNIILEKRAVEAQTQWIREMRKYPEEKGFAVGDLVYVNFEKGSNLQMNSRKMKQPWVGPLKIQTVLDQTHYLVSDWEGKFVPKKFHINRLKPYVLNLGRIGKGGLETATNTKQLFDKWQEIKKTVIENAKTQLPQN